METVLRVREYGRGKDKSGRRFHVEAVRTDGLVEGIWAGRNRGESTRRITEAARLVSFVLGAKVVWAPWPNEATFKREVQNARTGN